MNNGINELEMWIEDIDNGTVTLEEIYYNLLQCENDEHNNDKISPLISEIQEELAIKEERPGQCIELIIEARNIFEEMLAYE